MKGYDPLESVVGSLPCGCWMKIRIEYDTQIIPMGGGVVEHLIITPEMHWCNLHGEAAKTKLELEKILLLSQKTTD